MRHLAIPLAILLAGSVSALAADEGAKSFRIATATLAPDLLVRAAPALDPTGFLEASFKQAEETPIRIVIEDQLPVSEIADVQVELLPVTTAPSERDVRSRRGVLGWSFEAPPGESRDIRFGWRVRWPADKTIAYETRRP